MTKPNQSKYRIEDVPFESLLLNPYQPRSSRPVSKTIELAASIQKNGLRQFPVGRESIGKHIELEFGAGRLSAFMMMAQVQKRIKNGQTPLMGEFGLNDQDADEETRENFSTLIALASIWVETQEPISTMPVIIEDLTDRQMFEHAVVENNDREPLSTIDLANSMKTYIEQFGATSKEVGELYHLSGSTVRGMLRLLELPDVVQERLNEGSLSRGQANKLLVLQSISPDLVEKAANKIKADQPVREVDNLIESIVIGSKNTTLMWRSYQGKEVRAGYGLWRLDDNSINGIRPVDAKALLKQYKSIEKEVIKIDSTRKPFEALEIMIQYLSDYLNDGMGDKESAVQEFLGLFEGSEETFVRFLLNQVSPPTCADCQMHKIINDDHICANRPCHDWKKALWVHGELSRIADELSAPVYDPEKDGECYPDTPPRWGTDSEGKYRILDNPFDGLIGKSHDLRIRIEPLTSTMHPHTNSTSIQLVAIGKAAKKLSAPSPEEKKEKVKSPEGEKEKKKVAVPMCYILSGFIWKYIDLFTAPFLATPDNVIRALSYVIDDSTDHFDNPNLYWGYEVEDELIHIKRIYTHISIIGWVVSTENIDSCSLHYLAAMIKDDIAGDLGASLPADWLTLASDYETGVSDGAIDPIHY